MGSRGSKSGSGWTSERTAKGADGKEIALPIPLKYGKRDTGLSTKARSSLESWEDKRVKNKLEYSKFVDADGNIVGTENKGGRSSVNATITQRRTAEAMSHNHPRSEGGVLGGTFSSGDIDNFTTYNQKTYRATASEGTYSITKGKNFDASGLKDYYKARHDRYETEYKSAVKLLRATYNKEISSISSSGKTMSEKSVEYDKAWKKYNDAANRAFNARVIKGHNALIEGQQKYGYTYTLERRRK